MLETPLSPETPGKQSRRREEDSLFRRYAANPDPALRDALAERYLPLVRSLARRYAHGSEPMDDLVQVGSIGLLNAIERYDPGNGTAFSSFAVPTILGEIKRHFRDRTWSVRVPRSLQELSGRVRVTETDLEAKLGRSPTAAEPPRSSAPTSRSSSTPAPSPPGTTPSRSTGRWARTMPTGRRSPTASR